MKTTDRFFIRKDNGHTIEFSVVSTFEEMLDFYLNDTLEYIEEVYRRGEALSLRMLNDAKDVEGLWYVADVNSGEGYAFMDRKIAGAALESLQKQGKEVYAFSPNAQTIDVLSYEASLDERRFLQVAKNFLYVHEHQDCIELETWTSGGVNMIYTVNKNSPNHFLKQLEERVEYFDAYEEMDLHRQGESYRSAFSIEESIKDFEEHREWLKETLIKIRSNMNPQARKLEDTMSMIAHEKEVEEFMRIHDIPLEDSEGCIDSTAVADFACETLGRKAYSLKRTGQLDDICIFVREDV